MNRLVLADEKKPSLSVSICPFIPIENNLYQNGFGCNMTILKPVTASIGIVGGVEYYRTKLIGVDDSAFQLPGIFAGVNKNFLIGKTVRIGVFPSFGVAECFYEGDHHLLIRGGGDFSLAKRFDSAFEISATAGYRLYSTDTYDENLISAMTYGLGITSYF